MPVPTWALVSVDIDGTLTRVHGWAAIADALGKRSDFDRTQRRFAAGEITEDAHLRNLLRIAAGRRLGEIEAAVAATPKVDGIAAGVAELHRAGIRAALLTHNPPYVGDWYRRTFGFDDFEGTVGQTVSNGRIGPAGTTRADKARGLVALARRAGASPDRVVHIGDGRADARIFRRAGRGVALNSRLPEVERVADLVLRTDDFREVVRAVRRLGPRP
jgi:phosphoserine phosphatase